jgi:hypothetical protein
MSNDWVRRWSWHTLRHFPCIWLERLTLWKLCQNNHWTSDIRTGYLLNKIWNYCYMKFLGTDILIILNSCCRLQGLTSASQLLSLETFARTLNIWGSVLWPESRDMVLWFEDFPRGFQKCTDTAYWCTLLEEKHCSYITTVVDTSGKPRLTWWTCGVCHSTHIPFSYLCYCIRALQSGFLTTHLGVFFGSSETKSTSTDVIYSPWMRDDDCGAVDAMNEWMND